MDFKEYAILSGLGLGGSLFGSGLGAVTSGRAAARQYQFQRRLNEQAYDLTQKGYREMYGNLRYGLESAGYNPILATNFGSGGTFSSGTAAGMQPQVNTDVVGDAVNAYKAFKLEKDLNKAQISNLEADNIQKDANATLAMEQAQTEQYKRDNLTFQNAMLDIEKHLKEKDLAWYDRKAYADIYELMQRAENYRAIQSIESYNAQTARKSYQLNREMQEYEKDFEKRYKEFGKSHPYVRNSMETVGRFFKGFSANYSKK